MLVLGALRELTINLAGSRPLAALVAGLPDLEDNERRQLAALADKQRHVVEECCDCLRDLEHGRTIGLDVAARLWQDRRFLPDRGESLRPLIRELGIDEQ